MKTAAPSAVLLSALSASSAVKKLFPYSMLTLSDRHWGYGDSA